MSNHLYFIFKTRCLFCTAINPELCQFTCPNVLLYYITFATKLLYISQLWVDRYTDYCIFASVWVVTSSSPSPYPAIMMTSSNGNIFRVTGHLCGDRGDRWIPHTKAIDAELWFSLWSAPEINGWVKQSWGWWFETPTRSLWGWWFETPKRSLWHQCNDCVRQLHANKRHGYNRQ